MREKLNSSEIKKPTVGYILSQAIAVILGKPTILLLFFLSALIDSLALTVLFLSHSGIFNTALGPIIRRLWGEAYLHYPDNFILLPKLQNYSHICLLVTLGILISAIVIKKIQGYLKDIDVTTIHATGIAMQKYFPLLLVWIPIYLLVKFSLSAMIVHMPAVAYLRILELTGLLLFFQVVSAFLFPAIILSGKSFFTALGEGLVLSMKEVVNLIILLAAPVFLSVVVSYAKAMAPIWFPQAPELILVFLYAGIWIGMLIDIYITTVTTILYVKVRNI